jgi:hypothetical protein
MHIFSSGKIAYLLVNSASNFRLATGSGSYWRGEFLGRILQLS